MIYGFFIVLNFKSHRKIIYPYSNSADALLVTVSMADKKTHRVKIDFIYTPPSPWDAPTADTYF